MASRSTERASTLAEKFRATAVTYADLPGDADIVVVATPPQCHAADAIRLLDAGAAVLLEKPLCRTLEEADRLVAAAARHGGRLLYAENLAYAPIVQRMIALAPRVGALTHLEVRTLQGLPTWGAFTTDEWGGGALFDLGVHPLAIALLVANAAGEGAPPVPAPPGMVATFVAAAVTVSTLQGPPDQMDTRVRNSVAQGLEIVTKLGGWATSIAYVRQEAAAQPTQEA